MLNIEKDFLSNVDYLKSLVKEVKSKTSSDFDSNLIYEVTYADMYVTDLLTKVKDTKLAESINDIKVSLDLVISNIPDKSVKSVVTKSDYTKILKTKYNNIDDGSFDEEVAYSNVNDSLIFMYVKQKVPTIVVLSILLIIKCLGLNNIFNTILSLVDLDTMTDYTSDMAKQVFIITESYIYIIFSLVVTLAVLLFILTFTIDLLYLTLPFFRDILDKGENDKRFVSICAKSAVESIDGQLIKYKKIKSYNRVKRNYYWLQSMIDTLKSLDESGKEIDKDFLKSLIDLQIDLKMYKERSKEWYRGIAKIEFMHDRYLKSMERYKI